MSEKRGRGRPRKIEQLPGESLEAYRKRAKYLCRVAWRERRREREASTPCPGMDIIMESASKAAAQIYWLETDAPIKQRGKARYAIAQELKNIRGHIEIMIGYNRHHTRALQWALSPLRLQRHLPVAARWLYELTGWYERVLIEQRTSTDNVAWRVIARTERLLAIVAKRCRAWKHWPTDTVDEPEWCKEAEYKRQVWSAIRNNKAEVLRGPEPEKPPVPDDPEWDADWAEFEAQEAAERAAAALARAKAQTAASGPHLQSGGASAG